MSDQPARSTCRQRHRPEPAVRRTEGQAAADVDGVLGMMTADDGAAERRGAIPVNSIGWPHARARAVADSPAADFYFAIIR
jgi:hypothetical protein